MSQVKKSRLRSFSKYYFWFYLLSIIPLLYSYKISQYFIKSSLIEDCICWLINVVGLYGFVYNKLFLWKWFWILWLFWLVFYWSDLTWLNSYFIFVEGNDLFDLLYTVVPFLILQLPVYILIAFYTSKFDKNKKIIVERKR